MPEAGAVTVLPCKKCDTSLVVAGDDKQHLSCPECGTNYPIDHSNYDIVQQAEVAEEEPIATRVFNLGE